MYIGNTCRELSLLCFIITLFYMIWTKNLNWRCNNSWFSLPYMWLSMYVIIAKMWIKNIIQKNIINTELFNRIQSAEYKVYLKSSMKFNKIVKKTLKTVSPTLGIIHNEMTLGLDGCLWILPRTTRKHNVRFWILVVWAHTFGR